MSRALLLVSAGAALLAVACKKDKVADDAPPTVSSAVAPVPPALGASVTPIAAFDASAAEGQSPLEQARGYEANGQLWVARLVLEPKAMGSSGTPEELEFLGDICNQQGDDGCVAQVTRKLGRKLKLDGGVRAASSADGGAGAGPKEHKEPMGELAHERDLVLAKSYDEARKVLEPKVLDGKASREEIRLLRTCCAAQGDRMCVAVCDSKLK